MSRTDKDREISRDWNLWNMAFRLGFHAFHQGKNNPGKIKGTLRERGLHYGWTRASEGKPLPDDPMWTELDCDQLFKP